MGRGVRLEYSQEESTRAVVRHGAVMRFTSGVMNDGRKLTSQVDYPKGSIQNPMSDAELRAKFEHLAMLWSIGKDSTVLLWLARKAFLGHVPFPLVHVDTTYKIPTMIEYRDRLCAEWKLELVVGKNEDVLKSGITFPNGRATRVAHYEQPRVAWRWGPGGRAALRGRSGGAPRPRGAGGGC